MINDEENWGQQYAEIFNCQVGLFPISIWGCLLAQVDWKLVTGYL